MGDGAVRANSIALDGLQWFLDELQRLSTVALRAAHREHLCEQGETTQVARAWERLADAADALHAMLVRGELDDPETEPADAD